MWDLFLEFIEIPIFFVWIFLEHPPLHFLLGAAMGFALHAILRRKPK